MKLGDVHTFKAVARKQDVTTSRYHQPAVKPDYYYSMPYERPVTDWRIWVREVLDKPVEGMYIGWRTVYDGIVSWEDEYGTVFWQKRHHKVLLFVVNERSNPVRVFPEDVIGFEEEL